MPNHAHSTHALSALFLTGLTPIAAVGQAPVPDVNAYEANVQIEPPDGAMFFGDAVSCAGDLTASPDGFSDVVIAAGFDSQAWVFFGPMGTRDPSGAFSYYGSSIGSQLGSTLDGSGDFDGDGVNDIMIGEPNYSAGLFANQGRVLIYSGKDDTLLREWFGDQPDAYFGRRVRYFTDINSVPGDEVFVLSKYASVTDPTQTDLRTFQADTSLSDKLFTFEGEIVSNAGQVDGDSLAISDIAIGFPFDNTNGIFSGTVTYRKGTTGASIVPHFGPTSNAGEMLGSKIVFMGDINGDGFGDVLASSPEFLTSQGRVRVISGHIPFHETIHDFFGESPGDFFGRSIANIGDINADGVPDIAIGAPSNSPFISGIQVFRAGRVYLYSGATGELLMTFTGSATNDFFGWAVSSAGDFNGDGTPDLLITALGSDAPLNGSGMAYIFFLPRQCPADLNNDTVVDSADLAAMLANWGNCVSPTLAPCLADITGDGVVNSADISTLLSFWGGCPRPSALPLNEKNAVMDPSRVAAKPG